MDNWKIGEERTAFTMGQKDRKRKDFCREDRRANINAGNKQLFNWDRETDTKAGKAAFAESKAGHKNPRK